MKTLVKVCFVLALTFGLHSICFAEVKTPLNGLFSIDVPQGWIWHETPEAVMISSMDRKSIIQISEGTTVIPEGTPQDQVKEILKKMNEDAVSAMKNQIKPEMGISVETTGEEEVTLGGVYARQLVSSLKKDQNTTVVNNIGLINKGKAFSIIATYSKTDGNSSVGVDKILQTLKFS